MHASQALYQLSSSSSLDLAFEVALQAQEVLRETSAVLCADLVRSLVPGRRQLCEHVTFGSTTTSIVLTGVTRFYLDEASGDSRNCYSACKFLFSLKQVSF